jgi:hypothetical protein
VGSNRSAFIRTATELLLAVFIGPPRKTGRFSNFIPFFPSEIRLAALIWGMCFLASLTDSASRSLKQVVQWGRLWNLWASEVASVVPQTRQTKHSLWYFLPFHVSCGIWGSSIHSLQYAQLSM